MLNDICSCDVSLTDPAALAAWNGAVHGVLAHGQETGRHVATLTERAPDFVMGHALRGLACLMLGRRELYAAARAAAAEARRALALGGATRREQLWCAALDDWLAGRPTASIARMEEALRLNPIDTISMKLSQGIRFMLGDHHGMRRSIERVVPAYDQSHPLYGYALGCLSFALEETVSYAHAEHAGLLGLQFARDDAWGLHAVAHVYDMTHMTRRGIALIDDNAGAWTHCNNFRFHVWWHKALLHLDLGDHAAVLDLYDTKIRDEKTDDYRDVSNATSLLMRLEFEGVPVGDRWAELADLAETRMDDGCLAFADMHYMLALVGDMRSDAAARMTARVAQHGLGQDGRVGDMEAAIADPGAAMAQGLLEFGAARYDEAFSQLKAAQPKFQRLGGSHAQRDIFERLTIEAGLRAGRLAEAEALLQARTALRNGTEDSYAAARRATIADMRALPATPAAAE